MSEKWIKPPDSLTEGGWLTSACPPVSLALLEGWHPVWQRQAEADATGVQVSPVRGQVPDLMVTRAQKRNGGAKVSKRKIKESGLPS